MYLCVCVFIFLNLSPKPTRPQTLNVDKNLNGLSCHQMGDTHNEFLLGGL